MDAKFNINEHVVITGDRVGLGHGFDPGTVVQIVDLDQDEGRWDYLCQLPQNAYEEEWVAEDDLEPNIKPATDEEVDAAIASILGSA